MRFVLPLILATALLVGCQSPQPVARTWALPDGVKSMDVNGYDMAYVERGTGSPTVVLVHGAGVDYRYFAAQMEPFAAKYRTIAVSLRNYYPEPYRGKTEFNLNQQAADLSAFIKQLGVGPVHVVAHSRGATVSIYVTRNTPELVRTLTFAEGGTGMPAFSPDDPVQASRRTVSLTSMAERLSKGETDEGLEIYMAYVNGPGAWKTTPELTKQSLRDNAWTLSAALTDSAKWAPFTCDDARSIRQPVLLLRGETSPAIFGLALDKVQACLPRVERQTIMNSNHSMPRVAPAAFNAAVLEFIGRN